MKLKNGKQCKERKLCLPKIAKKCRNFLLCCQLEEGERKNEIYPSFAARDIFPLSS